MGTREEGLSDAHAWLLSLTCIPFYPETLFLRLTCFLAMLGVETGKAESGEHEQRLAWHRTDPSSVLGTIDSWSITECAPPGPRPPLGWPV